MKVSIGIMAYNEENNIGKLLDILISQKENNYQLLEIIVIASGCTDKTISIVKEYQQKNEKIKLLVQQKREGKASAINLFLKNAKGEIIVLQSADILCEKDALDKIVLPFKDKKVGAVACKIVCEYSGNFLTKFYTKIFWELHHYISQISPKCGEMLAFRNVLPEIAYNTATDETYIIAMLVQLGYKLYYAEEVLVFNKGAASLKEIILQRRRHLAGYIHLKKTLNYLPQTMNNFLVLKFLFLKLKPKFWELPLVTIVILIEIYARFLALYDWYIKKKNPYIWEVAQSTKKLDFINHNN